LIFAAFNLENRPGGPPPPRYTEEQAAKIAELCEAVGSEEKLAAVLRTLRFPGEESTVPDSATVENTVPEPNTASSSFAQPPPGQEQSHNEQDLSYIEDAEMGEAARKRTYNESKATSASEGLLSWTSFDDPIKVIDMLPEPYKTQLMNTPHHQVQNDLNALLNSWYGTLPTLQQIRLDKEKSVYKKIEMLLAILHAAQQQG
jgi:hypothetical protein